MLEELPKIKDSRFIKGKSWLDESEGTVHTFVCELKDIMPDEELINFSVNSLLSYRITVTQLKEFV